MIDVLVAGGGPAGLATAIRARLAGLTAVVVEPRTGPIDKACGEGLMPTGAEELAALGVTVDGHPLRGIRYLDGRRDVAAEFPGGREGLGVRRTALHAALAARAAGLGVGLLPGRVDAVRQFPGHVAAAGLAARWLVAADGLHSPVRTMTGLSRPVPGIRRYGLRRHYAVEPWSDFVEVHWAPGGEAYVTPVGPNLVGVAVLSALRRPYHEHLAEFPALSARLDGRAATPVRGAGPLRQRAAARVAGRVLLVGDAAGYVDALTGEGLSLALRSADALVRCLTEGRHGAYEGRWRRLSVRHRSLTAALLAARNARPTARLIVPAAHALPAVFRGAVAMLA
ncbi:oxidoreductase [Acrocarpospora phusangensis]|uniref:Oxidoreductase n=1 Tax=Acrocarpospora phusangensis TaxID=1070424 RepID=A0A919Q9X0_9ACTN|nr:NAD(P)/FAD-dependent oxidoreductase [Acrocarpospora phusangensis]GIH24728.1 oxidoreductase [Acrocarpospora phusangensis]